jgi:hypothetical protein
MVSVGVFRTLGLGFKGTRRGLQGEHARPQEEPPQLQREPSLLQGEPLCISVMDPKLFFLDLDPTLTLISDPDSDPDSNPACL